MSELTPANLQDGQKIDIRNCGSCDGSHQGIEVTSYKARCDPYTHHYTCPTTGDPVSTALRMRGKALCELNYQLADVLIEAEQSGRFMVAVWRVDADGRIHMQRSSHEFPYQSIEGDAGWLAKINDECGDYEKTGKRVGAIELLATNLGNEISPPREAPPQVARLIDNAPNLLGL